MGWKAIKEAFNITRHSVQVTDEGICIGSGYVHNLATISIKTGGVYGNSSFRNFLRDNYPKLLDATSKELLALIETPDAFSKSVTVYTYEGGDIIEKKCEEPDWPNVTHDGCMMYSNTYSTDKNKVAAWAKRSAGLAIKYGQQNVERLERELAEERARLEQAKADQAKLNSDFPDAAGEEK